MSSNCVKYRRKSYCLDQPSKCVSRSDICTGNNEAGELKAKVNRYCTYEDEDQIEIPHPALYDKVNESQWEEAIKYAHDETILYTCRLSYKGTDEDCKNLTRVYFLHRNEPNVCFTSYSLQGKPEEKEKVYSNTAYYDAVFFTEPDNYSIPTFPVTLQVALHDRRGFVNPFTDGYILEGNNVYAATVSMSENVLLEAPYVTNCTDYVKRWRKNNGNGPINQVTCIEECKMKTLLSRGKCIDRSIGYPHTNVLCKPGEVSVTDEILKGCMDQCSPACRQKSYEMQIDSTGNFNHVCDNNWCKLQTIQLRITFRRFKSTTFRHQPKFEDIELFSYIGGYMGMWLGLSLISLFNLFETICIIIIYPFGKWRWMKKMEKLLQNTDDYRRPNAN